MENVYIEGWLGAFILFQWLGFSITFAALPDHKFTYAHIVAGVIFLPVVLILMPFILFIFSSKINFGGLSEKLGKEVKFKDIKEFLNKSINK